MYIIDFICTTIVDLSPRAIGIVEGPATASYPKSILEISHSWLMILLKIFVRTSQQMLREILRYVLNEGDES